MTRRSPPMFLPLQRALALILLNLGLAAVIQFSAPPAPRNSDREAYEYVGQHGLERNCGWSIYCYRVLAPMALERVPIDAERRWRLYQIGATATAGALISIATLPAGIGAAAIASIL